MVGDSPKVKILAQAGKVVLFYWEGGHGVPKKGGTWGSARTLIATEGCLFVPNMFVNMGLTNL